MALCQSSVLKVYHAVIEDVIASVRDAFLDDGVDEQVLQEMKQIWRSKLMASKAVEINPDPPEQPPQVIANNPKPTKAQVAKAKKAAAAAAAANNASNNAAQNSTSTTSSTAVDVKPNIAQLQQAVNGPTSSTSGAGTSGNTVNTTLMNGTIKQEPQQNMHTSSQPQSQPPPLHPTSSSSALLLQQQKQQQQQQQAMAGSNQQSHQQPGGGNTSGGNQPQSSTIPIVAALDPNRIMPVNITLPAQPGTMNSESRVLTIHVPASALQENQLTQILTAHLISSIMSLPTTLASSVLQQHVNAALLNANMQKNFNTSKQMDGALDTSDEDESEESDANIDDDDNDDLDKDDESDLDNEGGAEEEPLNSEDDVTDEDATDLFDTDNVIVCQYDKITRSRNKWKFYLKDGIMNIGGKDYVFQKSNGDAEW
ncbi:transcription factor IIA L [Musca autumnalis]|uniref:transcription factor IIA L n=1 Tax=Musca autumnalis TaxID=221902 RepID=UPI003CF28A3E